MAVKTTMTAGFLTILLGIAAVLPAAAADSSIQHSTWTAGGVSGSTTAATDNWTGYDSDDGNAVILSTAFQSLTGKAGSWIQTDDSSGATGFNLSTDPLSFSSTAVVGAGSLANVVLSTSEVVSVEPAALASGRARMAVAYHVGTKKFYLFGGINANGTLSNEILEFDPVTKQLIVKSNVMPTARAGMTAAYDPIAGQIFTFGGFNASNFKMSDIHEYNPIANTLTPEPASLPTPRARMASAFDTATQKVYLFGGENFDGARMDAIVSYDGIFNTLVTLPTTLPSARYDASASFDSIRKTIHVFGGDSASGGLNEIIEFDPLNSTFTVRTAVLPSTRTQTTAAFHPITQKSYVLGGNSAEGISDQVIEFDPVADAAVIRNAALSSSRTYAAAGYDSKTERLYVFGGQTLPNDGETSQILQYLAFTSATFTSSVFDTGNKSNLGTLSYAPAAQFDPAVGMSLSFRAGNTNPPAGNFISVPNGGPLSGFGQAQYIQYRATFTTTNISTSPVLSDVAITYTQTAPSATLVSSAFDLGDDLSVIRKLSWEGSFPAGTGAQLQLRTAPNANGSPGGYGPWLGPTGGDFYTDPAGGTAINAFHRDGVADRFVQYRAILYSTGTLQPPNISSVTITYNVIPASPTIASLIAISSDSIVLTTIDNATTEDAIVVSTGFLPSPGNDGFTIATLSKPGTGSVQVSTVSGFPPNTAVFVRTRARNTIDSLDSFFSTELSTFTLANTPASLDASGVFGTSITITWSAESNPSGTLYEVSLSTDNFNLNISTPILFSDALTGTTTDLLSLAGGTTYYVRMRAQNGNLVRTQFSSVLSTATRVAPITAISGIGVGVSSVTFSWDSSGPSAQYRIYSATAGVVLQTVSTASATITGLPPNTTFAIRAEPFNAVSSAGLSQAATAFSLAAAPSALTPVMLGTGAVQLTWSAAGNPPATPYELFFSSDAFQTDTTTRAVFTDIFTNTTTTFVDLAAGTTYSFRVRAQNGDGIATAFVEASTQTQPGTVSAITGTALGISSIAWSWSNTAGPTVEFYRILRGSTGVELSTTSSTAFTDTNLLPNATYGLIVQAVNLSTAGALSAEAAVYTLAQPPTGTTIFNVFIDSISVSWNTNINPIETVYSIERSSDNALFVLAAASAAASMNDTNLNGNTTYYYRVRAANGAGQATAFDAVVSTFLPGLLPGPPSAFSAKSLTGGRVHLSWGISPSSTVVAYNVYFDSGTGVIDYSVLFASIAAPSTSYNTVPLSLGTSYYFGLRAENEKGEEENNIHVVAAAVSTAAPAALVAAIRAPSPGARISGNHLTVRAGLDEGSARDVPRIQFEYRAVGSGTWTPIAAIESRHPNPAVESPFATHWDVSGLAQGMFELRAVARDASGVDDPSPPSVRVRIDNLTPDISENRGVGTQVIQRVRVHKFSPVTTEIVDGANAALLTVRFASNALTSETDMLRINTDPAFKPVFSSSFSPTGIFREITLESGQTDFTSGRTATLLFSNLDRNGDNRVDGTEVRADNLRIAVYDTAREEWKLEIPSAVSSDNETTLTGNTPHFSLFSVVSPAALTLNEVRVYPNPYRPNNTNPDDGKPWSAGDPTSGIIFDGLPATGEIRIYSVTGSLVWRSPGPPGGGLLRWDAKNGDGREVASGVYFAVITDAEGRSTVGKVAIIR